MKKFGFIFYILTLVGVALLSSGCSGGDLLDIRAVMRAPGSSPEKEALKEAIEAHAGVEVSWRYPRTGDEKSAIIICDLTGDGLDEAVAFYRTRDEDAGFHVAIAINASNYWKVVGDFISYNTVLKDVKIEDVNGDGIKEITVNWGNGSGPAADVSVYRYDGESASEIIEEINEKGD